jgi:hypothetical protein
VLAPYLHCRAEGPARVSHNVDETSGPLTSCDLQWPRRSTRVPVQSPAVPRTRPRDMWVTTLGHLLQSPSPYVASPWHTAGYSVLHAVSNGLYRRRCALDPPFPMHTHARQPALRSAQGGELLLRECRLTSHCLTTYCTKIKSPWFWPPCPQGREHQPRGWI